MVDMMWFDHVGGQDWGKWRFDKLFEMMYRHQPELLVNNRAARFIRRNEKTGISVYQPQLIDHFVYQFAVLLHDRYT